MEDRPINSKGNYNLNFIDWNNEYENVIENLDYYMQLCPEEFREEEVNCDLNIDPKLLKKIKKMKMGKSKQTCSICLKNFEPGTIIRKLPCTHIMHNKCILDWFKQKFNCPLCKMDLDEYFNNK